MRLDQVLVQFFSIESRTKAQELIEMGLVKNLKTQKSLLKASLNINENEVSQIQILDSSVLKYVSRAGLKLEGALRHTQINVESKTILDIGQSTGGFTDALLQRGARQVVGVDVGENQLHPKIKSNEKVVYYEKINARYLLRHSIFKEAHPANYFDMIVGDISFISLSLIIPGLSELLKNSGEALFLVKPQFECGPENLNKNGIVNNPKVYSDIQENMIQVFQNEFGQVVDYFESSLLGKTGNKEFFIYAKKN